jgi:hypothetical protein
MLQKKNKVDVALNYIQIGSTLLSLESGIRHDAIYGDMTAFASFGDTTL